ncbi:MAG: hypothetical protein HRT61_06980 [Ekhidna sp.]|nr:hypothetical protein [Ekhidna sp.]
MKRKLFLSTLMATALGVMLAVTSCSDNESDLPEPAQEIEITSDQEVLSDRVTLYDQVITVESEQGARTAPDFSLRLKAKLTPPSIEGNLLQATSIDDRKDFFVVGYNYRGNEYYGGLDLVNADLKLKSQILYADADISDVVFNGDQLYFVGASSSLDEPAFIEKVAIKPSSETFSLDNNMRTSLGFYVANSVTTSGGKVYATVGDDKSRGGGLYSLDRNLDQVGYKKIDDARWAAIHKSEVLVLSGEEGKVYAYQKEDLSDGRSFRHQSVSEPGSRVTISCAGKYIFVAGGHQGLFVYNEEGDFVTKYSFGEGAYTNSVTAHRGLLFISNGEAGVYVASYDPFIEVIGKLGLEEGESVNQILYKEDMLYVSSGLGGVQMIQVVR